MMNMMLWGNLWLWSRYFNFIMIYDSHFRFDYESFPWWFLWLWTPYYSIVFYDLRLWLWIEMPHVFQIWNVILNSVGLFFFNNHVQNHLAFEHEYHKISKINQSDINRLTNDTNIEGNNNYNLWNSNDRHDFKKIEM